MKENTAEKHRLCYALEFLVYYLIEQKRDDERHQQAQYYLTEEITNVLRTTDQNVGSASISRKFCSPTPANFRTT